MKTVLLAAAALALMTTTAAADNAYSPKGPGRQARKTAVSHVGRSGGGSTGGATHYGTLPPENGAVNPTTQEATRMFQATMAAGGNANYSPNRTAGYSGRGLTGGGLGSYGRSLGSSRRLGEGGLPDVIVPGQLIRSAGLGYKISEPEAPPTLLAVDGGNRIRYEDVPGGLNTTGLGVHQGPRDTPPPPSPTSGGASGNTGITENRPSNNTTIIQQRGNNTIGN